MSSGTVFINGARGRQVVVKGFASLKLRTAKARSTLSTKVRMRGVLEGFIRIEIMISRLFNSHHWSEPGFGRISFILLANEESMGVRTLT